MRTESVQACLLRGARRPLAASVYERKDTEHQTAGGSKSTDDRQYVLHRRTQDRLSGGRSLKEIDASLESGLITAPNGIQIERLLPQRNLGELPRNVIHLTTVSFRVKFESDLIELVTELASLLGHAGFNTSKPVFERNLDFAGIFHVKTSFWGDVRLALRPSDE